MLFYFTVAYLLLEFGRPQDLFPALASLHLPGAVTAVLVLALLLSGKVNLSDRQTRWFAVLLALMAPHVPLAVNNYYAFETLKYMVVLFAVYLAIVTSVDTLSKFRMLVTLWLGVHLFLAIHGIAKQGKGVGGFLGDENDFAMTLNMVVPFALFLAFDAREQPKKLFYLGLAAIFVLANIFSFSRGGFVGLLAVALCCWLRSPRKLRSLVVIAALGLLVSLYAREGYGTRVQSAWEVAGSAGSGEERLYMWRFGWRMFLDNPVIGVGQGNFHVRFGDYEGEDRLHGRTLVWRAAHSLYLTLLPELGIAGGIIFFMMLYCIGRDLAAIRRWMRQGSKNTVSTPSRILSYANALEAGLVGFLVSSIFLSTLYYPNFWVTMGFVVALRRIARQETSRPVPTAAAAKPLVNHRTPAARLGLA